VVRLSAPLSWLRFVVPSLPPLFSEQPPDRERYILGQGFAYCPHHWTDRLPDPNMWPAELASRPPEGRWPRIYRRDVFDFARRLRKPLDAIHLYVAASAWGVGTKARLVTRRVWVLDRNNDPGVTLRDAARALRAQGPIEAYRAMNEGGDLRLDYLGPGFFTKVLYFTGWDQVPGLRQPLIMDQHVVRALNEQAGLGWDLDWNWTANQYGQYLDLAHEWAEDWGTAPDVVERRLFERGKELVA
jgi:hypothetical protein